MSKCEGLQILDEQEILQVDRPHKVIHSTRRTYVKGHIPEIGRLHYGWQKEETIVEEPNDYCPIRIEGANEEYARVCAWHHPKVGNIEGFETTHGACPEIKREKAEEARRRFGKNEQAYY